MTTAQHQPAAGWAGRDPDVERVAYAIVESLGGHRADPRLIDRTDKAASRVVAALCTAFGVDLSRGPDGLGARVRAATSGRRTLYAAAGDLAAILDHLAPSRVRFPGADLEAVRVRARRGLDRVGTVLGEHIDERGDDPRVDVLARRLSATVEGGRDEAVAMLARLDALEAGEQR